MSRRKGKGASTPPKPGSRWRMQCEENGQKIEMANVGIFDELVVDDWIHLEQMSDRHWWLQLGGACFAVVIARDGRVTVTLTEGEVAHGELTGPRFVEGRPWKPDDP
jgi:hypothetical protein